MTGEKLSERQNESEELIESEEFTCGSSNVFSQERVVKVQFACFAKLPVCEWQIVMTWICFDFGLESNKAMNLEFMEIISRVQKKEFLILACTHLSPRG